MVCGAPAEYFAPQSGQVTFDDFFLFIVILTVENRRGSLGRMVLILSLSGVPTNLDGNTNITREHSIEIWLNIK